MQRFLAPFSLLCLSALLAGCAMQDTAAPSALAIPTLTGSVHGGNQPVDHALIQLYAVGLGDYASGATPLITVTPVYTNTDGSFVITGDYHCPFPSTVDSLVYLTATGGNPGLDGDPSNSALALMTALGPCSTLKPSTSVSINELTTVASVWSLAQFMSGYASVGVTAGNYPGLKNAIFTSTQLVDFHSGIAVASTNTTTVPVAELNTLANILSACVNSTGDTSTPTTPCSMLFSATKPTGGTAATDTIGAALKIALNPLSNVSNIFLLASANPAFEPTLKTAPPDWTVGILTWNNTYTKYPEGGVIDGENNYWLTASYQNGFAAVSGSSPSYSMDDFFYGLYAPAFGLDGTLYGIDAGGEQGYGGYTRSSEFIGKTGGGITSDSRTWPESLAIAPNGNLWMILTNGAIAEFSPPGTPVSPSTGFTGLLPDPGYAGGYGSLFDSAGILYVSAGPTTIVKIDTNAITPTATTISTSGGGGAAFDHSGDLWGLSSTETCCVTVTAIDPSGAALASTPYTPGNFNAEDLAIDGFGHIWMSFEPASPSTIAPAGVATFKPSDLSVPAAILGTAFASTIPAGEFPAMVNPETFSIAIDESGNVWTTEANSRVDPDYFYNPTLELIGVAGPVTTPLALAVKNNTLGTRP